VEVSEMVTITPVAAEQLRSLQKDDPSRSYLRLYVAGQTCCSYRYGLAFDSAAEAGDAVDDQAGIRVAIDAESKAVCEGATIDFVTTPQGEGFVVRGVRTGGGGGCGCGRSG
jgi:iron-sulfur cluster insertion protein